MTTVCATLRAGQHRILVGETHPTRVSAMIGLSKPIELAREQRKLDALANMHQGPDIVADLSLGDMQRDGRLWKHVVADTPFVAATVPIYSVRKRNGKIDRAELLDTCMEQIEGGVGILTIHATPTLQMVEEASSRQIPCTSRGGAMVVRDLLCRGPKNGNVYELILDDLIQFAAHSGAVLSLGATFRSATIFDSCDSAQILEIQMQAQLADRIRCAGGSVLVEGPGHARPSSIAMAAQLLRTAHAPIMTLGPIPTDAAIGADHIAGAIGAVLLGLRQSAHILVGATREEHTGGIPSMDSLLEAMTTTRLAAHIIDLDRISGDDADREVAEARASHLSCVVGSSHGCSRCGKYCPLLIRRR